MTDAPTDLGRGLVDEWWDWAATGEALGVSVSKVRQYIREHQLAGAVPVAGRRASGCPAALVQDGEIVKGVPGVLTVLHDGGYDDRAGDRLAVHPRRHAARAARSTRCARTAAAEVKRRAQSMAF